MLVYNKVWLNLTINDHHFGCIKKLTQKDIGYDQDYWLDIEFWLGYQGGFKEKYEMIDDWS